MAPAATAVPEKVRRSLRTLGARLRARRKRLGLSATTTAEAAGMSRVTLRRIERGESSVTLGAYAAVLDALGLELDVRDPREPAPAQGKPRLPRVVRLKDYPQLRSLAWHLDPDAELSPVDALNLYERQWRHVDAGAMQPNERALVKLLLEALGKGRVLV